MSFDVTIPAFYIVFYGTLVEISFSFGCEKITFVKALFCPLQSSAFFLPKAVFPNNCLGRGIYEDAWCKHLLGDCKEGIDGYNYGLDESEMHL